MIRYPGEPIDVHNPAVLEQLANPESISKECIYYILYPAYKNLESIYKSFSKWQKEPNSYIKRVYENDLFIMQALHRMVGTTKEYLIGGLHLGAYLGLGPPTSLFYGINDDEDSKEYKNFIWGRELFLAVMDSPFLTQVWESFMASISLYALCSPLDFVKFSYHLDHFKSVERDNYGDIIHVTPCFFHPKLAEADYQYNVYRLRQWGHLQTVMQVRWEQKRPASFDLISAGISDFRIRSSEYESILENAISSRAAIQESCANKHEYPLINKDSSLLVEGYSYLTRQRTIVNCLEDLANKLRSDTPDPKALQEFLSEFPEYTPKKTILSVPIPKTISDSRSSTPKETEERDTMAISKQQTTDSNKEVKEGGEFKNVALQYSTDPEAAQIILPNKDGTPMTITQAIYWLKKIEQDHNREMEFQFKFEGRYPLDAIYAVYQAMVKLYGMVHVGDFGFGFWKSPPKLVSINTGLGKHTQIPFGPLEVTGISVPLEPGIDLDKNGYPILVIKATIKNFERERAQQLVDLAVEYLKTRSLYKGQAIEVDFEAINPRDARFDWTRGPVFMDTKVDQSSLIFSKDVFDRINASLWTPIERTDLCEKHHIPLRRGILLAGPYGTGKTLTAKVTAKKCQENGWTFLYLKDLNHLVKALTFAKQYAPCVVFAEDLNQITDGERGDDLNKILNTLDGVDTKNDRIIKVFTTNELRKIHPSVCRPGRIDDIIKVSPPDKEATIKLLRFYGRDLIEPNEDLSMIGELLSGQIPAIIAETVERSKLAAIVDSKEGEPLMVSARHLKVAAHQMLEHAELLKDPPKPAPGLEILGKALGEALTLGIANVDGNTPALRTEAEAERAADRLLEIAGDPRKNRAQLPE